jgi:16S rRNA (adenine1518-N6/adenine1519-N6)-dimethyltransferase
MLTPTKTREILEKIGQKPRQRLGQNFLIDSNIVRKSLELADIQSTDTVVEVGPGLGTLSLALLEAGVTLYAVELDLKLAHYLEGELKPRYPQQFHLLQADALAYPRGSLPETITHFKIVSNLPYAISTPWLDAILDGNTLPSRMVLMLQKEAAQRFEAQHGTKTLGPISIFLQSAYSVLPGHKVSRTCFYPVPTVESFLFCLEKKPTPYIFNPEVKLLIRHFFTQRRKQIGSLCRNHFEALKPVFEKWLHILAQHDLSEQSRPENIPTSLWQKLDQLVIAHLQQENAL